MPRKKLPQYLKRRPVNICLNAEEQANIDKAARARGVYPSVFIREAALKEARNVRNN
jgi:uncharacterized protein (DUF1778 family)